MPARAMTSQSARRDDPSLELSISVIEKCRHASSSRIFFHHDTLSPKRCLTTPHESNVPVARRATVTNIFPTESPSKEPSKGMTSLKSRLKHGRYSLTPSQPKPAPTPADADFVNDLLRGGKHVPKFQKRRPSIRTAERKYEKLAFRQRLLAFPDEVRNRIYDYIILGDTADEGGFAGNCGAGFVDCSRGFISFGDRDCAGTNFLDDVPIRLQSRPYGASSSSSMRSHTSCSSPSTRYNTSFYSSVSVTNSKEPQLQFSSKDGKLHAYHANPIPIIWSKYIQKGDTLWKDLMRRWSAYEDAKVHFQDQLNVSDIDAFEEPGPTDNADSDARPAIFPPLFQTVHASVREKTLLQYAHNLHLALTIHGIPLHFSPSIGKLTRSVSLFSIHETRTETGPLSQAVSHIISSLKDLVHLDTVSMTLTLYPGPVGDTTSHGHEKYFTSLEEIDGLWEAISPLKSIRGMERIIVRRLGACVRWGLKGSSLFPTGDRVSVVEGDDNMPPFGL